MHKNRTRISLKYNRRAYVQLKAMENRYVFSRDLKAPMDWADLMGRGNVFQSLGPAAANARSPLLLLLVGKGISSILSADLKALDGT